jgi:pyruvate,water dikinase
MLVGGSSSDPVAPGAVLVARIIHPHMAPLLFQAAAVVVEEGALLQHATVLAREFGLPAVVAVEGATSVLASGEWVEVDGDAGVVRRRAAAKPQ